MNSKPTLDPAAAGAVYISYSQPIQMSRSQRAMLIRMGELEAVRKAAIERAINEYIAEHADDFDYWACIQRTVVAQREAEAELRNKTGKTGAA